jgi:predicted nucleotidyltransferase
MTSTSPAPSNGWDPALLLSAPASYPGVLQTLTAALSAFPTVQRILLFGSRARGDARLRSDIDLAVEAPDMPLEDWQRMIEIVEQAPTLLEIDLVRLDDAGVELRTRIEDEGEVLYSRVETTR